MRTLLSVTAVVLSLGGASALASAPHLGHFTPSRDVRVLGPFTVTAAEIAANWNPAEHVGDAELVTLPEGTVILDFWAEIETPFDGGDVHLDLAVSTPDGEVGLADNSLYVLDVADVRDGIQLGGGTNDERRASDNGGASERLPGRMLDTLPVEACVWTDDAPPTIGEMSVYVEVATA